MQKQQPCSSGVTSPVAKGRRTSGFAEKENAFEARSGCVCARSCSAERRPSSTLKRRWRTKSQCSLAPSARPKSTALYRRTESAAFAPYLAASHVAGTGPRTHSMRASSLAEEEKTGRITFQREVVVGGSFVFPPSGAAEKTSGGFFLLAPDAGLARRDYCEPQRTGGNFKNRAWSNLPSSFVVVSLQKCSMFTTSVVLRSIGGRVVRNVPGLLICLFLLPRGEESTAQNRPALGLTSDTGFHSASRSCSLRRHRAQQQPRNAGSTGEGTRAPRSRNHI